ncbi:Arginine N-succinyltransferase subunit beta [compost metagenome]
MSESRELVLSLGTPGDGAEVFLIHNRQLAGCRITAAHARVAAGSLVVDDLAAKRLKLGAGSLVRAVPLSPGKAATGQGAAS